MKQRFFLVVMMCAAACCAAGFADLLGDNKGDEIMKKPTSSVSPAVEVKTNETRQAELEAKLHAAEARIKELEVQAQSSSNALQVAANPPPVVTGVASNKVKDATHKKVTSQKKKLSGRPAIITAECTSYDRKEGVIFFDKNVFVDDEQYKMHADKIFVFLEGTNDLNRLVAIGNVAITNEEKSATCARATYQKKTGKIVMYGNETQKAVLKEDAKKGSSVVGERITFWLNSEQVEVEGSTITMPNGGLKGTDAKNLLQMK